MSLSRRGRVVVEVKLFNPGTVTWTPSGTALVGAMREALTGLMVWPLEPIPLGAYRNITVEMNATESEARGTYTHKLWAGEAGAEVVTLDGVMFP